MTKATIHISVDDNNNVTVNYIAGTPDAVQEFLAIWEDVNAKADAALAVTEEEPKFSDEEYEDIMAMLQVLVYRVVLLLDKTSFLNTVSHDLIKEMLLLDVSPWVKDIDYVDRYTRVIASTQSKPDALAKESVPTTAFKPNVAPPETEEFIDKLFSSEKRSDA